MRRTLQSAALVLALSVPGYAGIMQCPVVEPTPQPARAEQESAAVVQEPTADGETSNNLTTSIVEVLLNLLALA